jgi:hypothetical protein
MNAKTADIAIAVLEALPTLVTASTEVLDWIRRTAADLKTMQAEGRDPTPEEWAALHARIGALRGELNG